MVELEELLVNLKEFISPFCYTKEEDETLFKSYLKTFYYTNGGVNVGQNYQQPTTYVKGELKVSIKKDVEFFDGEFTASSGSGVTMSNGILYIP